MKKKIKTLEKIVAILISIIIITIGTYFNSEEENQINNNIENNQVSYEITNIPEYSGNAYVQANNNVPKFTTQDMNIQKDYYSDVENGRVRNGYDKNKLEKSK